MVMGLHELSAEQIEHIRAGAQPLFGRDVASYYTAIEEALRKVEAPSSRAVLDAVQWAQRRALA
jgi:hypothetical protein